MTRFFRSLVLLSFLISSTATSESRSVSNADECVYTLYVRTGTIIKAGTDSKISVELEDAFGDSVRVKDLEEWGMMGPHHEYFEWANLDIFSGRGPCVASNLCRLNLTSDGTGSHHGWYCNYVEVTTTGPHRSCTKTAFEVEQWLATDAPPYSLTAVLDGCGFQKREKPTDQMILAVKNKHSNDFEMNDHQMPGGSDASL